MRIIFAGTPKNAAVTLDALIKTGQNVVAVLTREDAPVGRKKILTESAVATIAEKAGIPIIKANKITAETNQQLESFKPELGVAVAYGAIFKTDTLKLPKNGWINLHYSLLPAWRGAAPVQHSILSGSPETGVSIFQLDEGMDTGPLLSVVPTMIEPGETAGELLERLTHLGISGVLELLPAIEAGVARPQVQSTDGISLAPKFQRQDAKIDWQRKARSIELQVRALNPEPMAWATLEEMPLRIIEAVALGAVDLGSLGFPSEATVGQVVLANGRVYALCGESTAIEIKTIQPSGKNPMDARSWARGLKKAPVLN